MATHEIVPARDTLHGDFRADRAPILTVAPGDTVVMATLDAGWGTEPYRADGSPRRTVDHDPAEGTGHALCGPIAVTGARPGTTLAVTVDEIVPGDWGWTLSGGWDSPFNRAFGLVHVPDLTLRWEIDQAAGLCRDQFGHTVPIRPFLGVMGLAPATAKAVPTAPPRPEGGNLDCRELVAGSTLYLPVAVEGALFSAGDGHAAQGDGEISGTAIECPMRRVALRFDVLDDLPLTSPRARTPTGWLTFGFDEDLDGAVWAAMNDMLALMGDLLGVDRPVALGLASLVVQLRVTQMVNGVKGAHALIAHEDIARLVADRTAAGLPPAGPAWAWAG